MSHIFRSTLLTAAVIFANGAAWAPQAADAQSAGATCQKTKLFAVREQQWGGSGAPLVRSTYKLEGKSGFFYTSGMTIDADGSYRAFHSISSKGTDDLKNAGHPGNWWGLVTDSGEPTGRPVVQGPKDPAPGFYISQTGIEDTSKGNKDPRRYADADRIPYIVLSGASSQNPGATFGDYAVVYNRANKTFAYAMYGDHWPTPKVGEGSIALAKALGIPASARDGGIDAGVTFLVFPKSRTKPWHSDETDAELHQEAEKVFAAWGGIEQLTACLNEK